VSWDQRFFDPIESAQTGTCLLLDIHLRGISGIELQRRLAASGSKCPVIFMMANDDEANWQDVGGQ
jgi:FixJ family two-component response regulator